MQGIKFQYIRLEIKRTAIAVRHMAVRSVLAVIMLTVLLGCVFYHLYRSVEAKPIKVALIVPEDQEEVVLVSKLMAGLDSVKNICTFIYPEEKEVSGLMEKGELQAAVIFTEDFYNDVNYGKNTPVTILLDDKQTYGTALFQELLYAGLFVIDVTEAACYAMEDTVRQYEAVMPVRDAVGGLLDDYVADAFYTREAVSVEILSPTGEVELAQYYVVVLLLLLLLLYGSRFFVLYDVHNVLIEGKLRVYGVGTVFRTLCKMSLMTGVLWILELSYLTGIKLLGAQAGFLELTLLPGQIVSLLLPAASIACFYHGIFCIGPDQKERKRLTVPAVLCMLILSGCLVPVPYLPIAVQNVSAWMPFTAYRCFLEQALFDQDPDGRMLLVWSLLFLGMGAFGQWQGNSRTKDVTHGAVNIWKLIIGNSRNGGIRGFFLRIGLFIKWQWKKKSPVVVTGLYIGLFLLCSSISFPEKEQNGILICNADQDAVADHGGFLLEQSMFGFDFGSDEAYAKEAVLSGKMLAACVKKDEGIVIYTAAYSPKVMAAKEMIAAIFFAERQSSLLQSQSRKVFGENAPAAESELLYHFQTYMRSDKLLRIIFKTEEDKPSGTDRS